ncbi:MAG: RNA methyltransferase [Bdellovibrionota bacterium]
MKISSSQNANFKFWKELKSAKSIRESQYFFLMGEKIIKEFLSWPEKNPSRKKFELTAEIFTESHPSVTSSEINKYELPNGLFKELDVIGTGFNLLLLKYTSFEKFNLNSAPQGLEVLSPLGDPGNMGALVRSALAFGVNKIILTKESCHPFHPRALKASAGASLLMDFAQTEESFLKIPIQSYDYFLDQDGKDIFTFAWPQKLRLWVGEEGPGISELSAKNPQQILSIKTQGVESLNATVAASLAISQWSRNQP